MNAAGSDGWSHGGGRPHGEARAHSGALRQFLRFAELSGLALDTILPADLLAIARQSATSEHVPAHGIIDMLGICAAVSGRADLGAAYAAWCNMRAYGPISRLWDHVTTLEERMRVTGRFLHLENEAFGAVVEAGRGDEVVVRHFLSIPAPYGAAPFLQATLMLELRLARMILGEEWAPVRLELDQPPLSDARFLRRCFRCPIVFDAGRSAVILREADMHRASSSGDAGMISYLERYLESAEHAERRGAQDFVAVVELTVAAHLAGGLATLSQVADALAISPRTLQRRLAVLGLTFANVLATARQREAEAYFAEAARPCLAELANRLGYRDTSATSRFLRQQMGAGRRRISRRGPGRSRRS